jgi:hypothetical protein
MKMNKSTITKLALFILAMCLLISLSFYAQSGSQSFITATDVLDGFSGRASSTGFSERISSGGQPSVVGVSASATQNLLQGYVNTAAYEHGDANADGITNISDVVYLITYVLKSGPEPIVLETGDVTCDNLANITDITYLINYVLKSGARPCDL